MDIAADFFYLMDMLAPEQSRAARGWLDWSQEELAKRANVSLSTVRDFEKGRRIPIANNLAAMRAALENAGMLPVHNKSGQPAGLSLVCSGAQSPAPGTDRAGEVGMLG